MIIFFIWMTNGRIFCAINISTGGLMSKIDESISVYKKINVLKDINRQGWVDREVPGRIESVAEHCFAMSNLAILINLQCNLNLDLAKMLTMINTHEYGEAKIGDITPKAKIKKEEKYNMELDAIVEILGNHTGRLSIIELWKEFEAQQTDEAIFVMLLDKFQSVLQAREYAEKYNRIEVYDEFANYYIGLLEKKSQEKLPESAKLLSL